MHKEAHEEAQEAMLGVEAMQEGAREGGGERELKSPSCASLFSKNFFEVDLLRTRSFGELLAVHPSELLMVHPAPSSLQVVPQDCTNTQADLILNMLLSIV
jgi:hypothetical protein